MRSFGWPGSGSVIRDNLKGVDESTLVKDLPVSVMQHDTSDPGSLMLTWIIPKECTLRMCYLF